mmetsp:Transcript_22594/g.51710  ORF Transcript_22594/g.51710 Transcript_22594/m.51710 type:complete len:396 (+) Transcript_22594:63-1250(+)
MSAASEATEKSATKPRRSKVLDAVRARKCTSLGYNLKCIGEHPLFKERNPQFVQMLASEMDIRIYCPGELILKEGEMGESAYVLHHGTVDVLAGERQAKVASLGAGTLFGEMILLGVSRKRTATIRAVDYCDCRVIPRDLFLAVLRMFPKELKYFKTLAKSRLESLAITKRNRAKSFSAPSDGTPSSLRRKTLTQVHSFAGVPWPHDAVHPDPRDAEGADAREYMLGETFQLTPRSRTGEQTADDLASPTFASDSPPSRLRARWSAAQMQGEVADESDSADEEHSCTSTVDQVQRSGAVAEMWHQVHLQEQKAQSLAQRELEPQIPPALPVRPRQRPLSASTPRRRAASRPQSACPHRLLHTHPPQPPEAQPQLTAATAPPRRPQSATTPRWKCA